MTVRLAKPSDARELKALNDALQRLECSSVDYIEEFIGKNRHEIIIVAEFEGKLIGFCCGQKFMSMCDEHDYAEITEIFVHPDYRRNGVGKQLIEYMNNEFKKIGVSRVQLMSGKTNETAHEFYRSVGFNGRWRMYFEKDV